MAAIQEVFSLPGQYGMSTPMSPSEVTTGTTTMAVEFEDGVIIGADSRTTTGSFVANRVTDKLTPVTDYIYCCRSGSAADTQALANGIQNNLEHYEILTGEPVEVKTAAHVFKRSCYEYRDRLTAGIIVAGWDRRNGGQVYSIPIGGLISRESVAIGGSGSTYIYGYIDANFKPKMSKKECTEFVKNAITLAMNRDGSSGGICRIAIITKDGVERMAFAGKELPSFYEG